MIKPQISNHKQILNPKSKIPSSLETENWILDIVWILMIVICNFFKPIRSIRNLPAKAGFTLMETLLVFGLMGAMAAMGVVSYAQVRQREEIAASVLQITQLISNARSKSVAGQDDSSWKVNLQPNLIELQTSSGQTFDRYVIPAKYILSGPTTELTFDRTNGRVIGCESGCIFTLNQVGSDFSYQFGVIFSGTVEY
jgi:type II secretory pathway pseudopilin PulG